MAGKYRNQRMYHEYRGRRRRGNPVLKVIIALLVLLLVAFLLLMVFTGGKIEYTDEGVHLVLPWLDEKPDVSETPSDPVNSEPPVFIIDEPEEDTPEPSPEPSPEPVLQQIGAVEVTDGALLDGRAEELVAEAGGNALVVEMKSAGGTVYWDSEAALPGAFADPRGTATDKSAVSAAVRELAEQGELYLVARVVCFRDQVMAADRVGGPLMTKGGNMWYDTNGLRWVSPASEAARSYLISLCLELAELGFDEILLEHAGYPYFGETHVLATDELRPEDLSGAVEQFWRELKAALTERNVRLSILVTEEMAQGTEEYSGIIPELLERYADRVWTTALPEGSILADRLVVMGGTSDDGSWAHIDPTVD